MENPEDLNELNTRLERELAGRWERLAARRQQVSCNIETCQAVLDQQRLQAQLLQESLNKFCLSERTSLDRFRERLKKQVDSCCDELRKNARRKHVRTMETLGAIKQLLAKCAEGQCSGSPKARNPAKESELI